MRGMVSLVFGPPGNAKSFFVNNIVTRTIADEFLQRPGASAYYIPLEYDRLTHVKRSVGIWMRSWKATSHEAEDQDLFKSILDSDENLSRYLSMAEQHISENASIGKVDESGNIIIPEVYYDDIIQEIQKAAAAGHDLIVVDPITAIDKSEKSKKTEWDQQKSFIRQCGPLAKHLNIHICLVSHSGKRQKHKGTVTSLTMDDMAGVAAFQRFVQYIFIIDLHRPPVTSRVYQGHGTYTTVEHSRTLIVEKTNFGCGAGVALALEFDGCPEMRILGKIEPEEEL